MLNRKRGEMGAVLRRTLTERVKHCIIQVAE